MAILGFLGMSSRLYLPLHTPLFRFVRKLSPALITVGEVVPETHSVFNAHTKSPPIPTDFPEFDDNDSKLRNWKRFSSKELGITPSMIPKPTRKVLNGLKKRGYEVYLVGGCVRDLILNRIPKDFDIITSAELKEVSRTFSWCEIVGRRFPICHVHIDGTLIEVDV